MSCMSLIAPSSFKFQSQPRHRKQTHKILGDYAEAISIVNHMVA